MNTAARLLRNRFLSLGATIFANPVVVRDLRAQMRGTKSYWFQGAYLLLLGILAIAGYAMATGQTLTLSGQGGSDPSVSIIEAQRQLEQLYYFIFMTLAALITLIAPALTASSVVGERQRLSLDLLVTTPLTAAELLMGKLISSIAFLGLLLVLSLPASILCVLLGGATIGDVFRVYATLAIDGMVLAAIGVFFSCANKTSLLAVIWSYVAVAAFLGLTYGLFGICSTSGHEVGRDHLTALVALAALNPFVAVLPTMQQGFGALGITLPTWLGAGLAAALLIRLLVTAATYRLGAYGGSSAPSMRRQTIVLSGIFAFLVTQTFAKLVFIADKRLSEQIASEYALILSMLLVAGFLCAVPFLAGLFVPASAEDAPPGTVEASAPLSDALYSLKRAFYPRHSGALPLFHLWLMVVAVAAITGIWIGVPARAGLKLHDAIMGEVLLLTVLYLSGLGFLFWAMARFAATLAKGASGARGLAFGLFVLFAAMPLLVLTLLDGDWSKKPIAALWLFYPILKSSGVYPFGIDQYIAALAKTTGLSYGLGILFLIAQFAQERRNQFKSAVARVTA